MAELKWQKIQKNQNTQNTQKNQNTQNTVLKFSNCPGHEEPRDIKKIVMFDMDHTLIKPASGAVFPKNSTDWKWTFDNVKDTLKKLLLNSTRVVVISNQGWQSAEKIERAKSIVESWTQDFSNLPIEVFLLTGKDRYRKPFPGVVDLIFDSKPDRKIKLIYVGDSETDMKFAYNVQLYLGHKVTFMTPEQYFLNSPGVSGFSGFSGFLNPENSKENSKKASKKLTFDPTSFMANYKTRYGGKKLSVLKQEMFKDIENQENQEVILMVGPPGIGKSSFTQLLIKNFASQKNKKQYRVVSQDDYASDAARRALARMRELLEAGYSVIVDNTHSNRDMRRRYIIAVEKFAESAGLKIPIRAFILASDLELDERIALAKHLDSIRVYLNSTKPLPEVAYRMFKSKWNEPALSEGFNSVEKINFVPLFKSKDELKVFMMKF